MLEFVGLGITHCDSVTDRGMAQFIIQNNIGALWHRTEKSNIGIVSRIENQC